MPVRRESESLTKVTLNLFSADVEELITLFDEIGYTKAVRYIVRNHLVALRQKKAREATALVALVAEIDLSDLEVEGLEE